MEPHYPTGSRGKVAALLAATPRATAVNTTPPLPQLDPAMAPLPPNMT